MDITTQNQTATTKNHTKTNKLPKLFIYPEHGLQFEWPYFTECTKVQNIFGQELKKYPQVEKVEDADIAFFPLTLGTAFQHQRSPHIPLSCQPNLQYQWRKEWSHRIASTDTRKKVKHFMILSYVLYNIQLQWIPSDITVFAYECEITIDILGTLGNFGCYNRIHVIPYYAEQSIQKNVENRKLICYVGSSTHAQSFREHTKSLFVKIYKMDVFEPNENLNYVDLFSQYKYVLVLRGDTPTRCGFYQAIQAGSIPIIYKQCLLHYKQLYNKLLPIEDMCVILPAMDLTTVEGFLEHIDDNKIREIILRYKQDLCYDYQIEGISAPVYHSMNSLLKNTNATHIKDPQTIITKDTTTQNPITKKIVFIPPLLPKYNLDFLPCTISSRDIVKGTFTSQYELELWFHQMIEQHHLITSCVEQSDFVFIPFYTFLSGWNSSQFSQTRIVTFLSELLEVIPSWKQNTKPHMLVYSDVCWPNDDFFLSRITLPSCTVLVSLESLVKEQTITMITSPYLSGFEPQTHATKDKWFLTYIGRLRPPFDKKEPLTELKNFHFIEMDGWKSINEETFLDFVKTQYTQSTFSLQPYGDRGTRRGFYQSLLCGCIPVIFSNNKFDYQQHTQVPIDSFAIVLGKDLTMSQIIQHLKWMKPDYILQLHRNIDQYLHHYVFDRTNVYPLHNVVNSIF